MKNPHETLTKKLSPLDFLFGLFHFPLSDQDQESQDKNTFAFLGLGIIIILVSLAVMNNTLASLLLAKKNNFPLLFLGLNTITSVFVHGDMGHLMGNMKYFFLMAPFIEKRIGSSNLILLFFGGNFVGALLTFVHMKSYQISPMSIGASAGTSALLAYAACTSFEKKITLFKTLELPRYTLLIFLFTFITRDINGLANMGSKIGHWAHIGGYVGGFLFWVIYQTPKYPLVDLATISKNHLMNFLIIAFFPVIFFFLKKKHVYGIVILLLAFKSYYMSTIVCFIIYYADSR